MNHIFNGLFLSFPLHQISLNRVSLCVRILYSFNGLIKVLSVYRVAVQYACVNEMIQFAYVALSLLS